jgi:carboxylesterase
MPGAEPLSATGTVGHGVLVLHGFTGNPQSMRPLAEACVEAGFSVEMPLLPGHGTAVSDIIPTRYSDYLRAADDTYLGLAGRCEKVVVAGLSMGGTLALSLAIAHPEIAGAVLVNPLVEPPAESFVEMFRTTLQQGTETFPGIGSDIAKEGVTELSYPETPIAALLSLFDAVGEQAEKLGEVTCPVLLYSSRQDHVVPPSNGDFLASALGGPVERVFLERSYHVATIDHDGPSIAAGLVGFARKLCGL